MVNAPWWAHLVAILVLFPFYGLIALTVWQGPSRQPLNRRVWWSVLLTVGALFIIGIPAYVVFSRRWYWLFRFREQRMSEWRGVSAGTPDAANGYFEWVAVGIAALVERLTTGPTPPPPPPLPDPWGSFLADAAATGDRFADVRARARGLAVDPVERAFYEGARTFDAAQRVAAQAAQVDAGRLRIDRDAVQAKLTHLEAKPATADVVAACTSLRNQLAAADRMGASLDRLEGQLHRLVAQMSEAATCAEELTLRPEYSAASNAGLITAVDGLVALRSALDQVDILDTSRP